MDALARQLFDEAAKLPLVQRAQLAEAILESLAGQVGVDTEVHIDPAAGRAWGKTVERRVADDAAGKVDMIPSDEALPGHRDRG